MKSCAALFDGGTDVANRKENFLTSLRFRPVILALAAVALASALRAQPFASAHWKSKTQMEGGPQGDVTTDAEIWMKDKKIRMKMAIMGMDMNMVRTGDFVYQWQEGQSTGMKIPTTVRRRGGPSTDYVSKIEDVRAKGKKVGTETVEGHPCDIYEYEETTERAQKEKYWLAKDLKNFPIRYQAQTGDTKITTTNSDVDLAAAVSDSMMTPPDKVQFRDMSEMMKGMPRN
jgi:outer membrane lipoprotein-sorting protein